ncbi:MAG: hypothetical protein MRY79_02945 [Alphaproteobacteria bacterium]|nr:hypothetical protein [Alphaproteobacteria bacterium]
MIGAINTALSGLLAASKRVEEGATNIAQSTVSGAESSQLIEDIVDIKIAETSYKANLATLKVADEMSEELLDSFDQEV